VTRAHAPRQVTASFLEIYNETLYDLLDGGRDAKPAAGTAGSRGLEIRQGRSPRPAWLLI
jgi:hypothetical protein